MFVLPGSGFPICVAVFLPIMIGCPIVVSLNHFKSPEWCQGVFPSLPIGNPKGVRLPTATIALTAIT